MSSIRALSILFAVAVPLVACTASTGDSDESSASSEALSCDMSGTWAIKIETPVKWPSSFVLQAGTGTVTNWLLSSRVTNGLTVTDTAEVCGAVTPDYQAAALFGSEKYGIAFSDAAFAALPKVTMTGSLSTGDVGGVFTAPTIASVVGATLANPATDAWPTNVANLVAVDADGDGKPGVTADAKTDAGMSLLPVNAQRTARADRVYSAFRQVVTGTTGSVKSCSRVEGTGQIAVISGKPAIDSHVVGCRRTDGAECAAGEYKLLDSAAPQYQPTGDAVITMVKLPAGAAATCAAVKALDFASIQ